MNKDKINVILCCYQGEAYIAEQLDSVLSQTYPFVEIFVSDDCSSDDTYLIVESYCNKHTNIILHKNSANIGFLKNFEATLSRVNGDYFALCDQDDIWHADKLAICMRELKLIEVSQPDKPILVHSDLELIDETGKLIESSFFARKGLSLSSEKSLSQILGHCGIMGNTILMNRHLVDMALPFPETLTYHDYWFALITECFGVRKTIPKSLLKYRLHETNTSNNNQRDKRMNSLPFMQDNRPLTIKYLLDNYDLTEEDNNLINRFYEYLQFDGSRLTHFIFLLKKGFFKSNLKYRINAFFRIMFAKVIINK